MIRVFCDTNCEKKIVSYVLGEIFRYLNSSFEFVDNVDDAEISYSLYCGKKTLFHIVPQYSFWKNYTKKGSLDTLSPLTVDGVWFPYSTEKGPDYIVSSFFYYAQYETVISDKKDSFGRFLYSHSLYKQAYSFPYVDEYRKHFVFYLKTKGIHEIRPWGTAEFALFLSHDVDGLFKYRSCFLSLAKIILKPSKFKLFEMIQSKLNKENDPYYAGVKLLTQFSRKFGFKSTFFFISKRRSNIDDFYSFDSKDVKKLLKQIINDNFEIGMHGSSKSTLSLNNFTEELRLFPTSVLGNRQHYLIFNPEHQASLYSSTELVYDSSISFPDFVGFRCGTTLPFLLFDYKVGARSNVWEIPFYFMDVTLKNYLKVPPMKALEEIRKVLLIVQQKKGVFSFNWHPGNCSDEWTFWITDFYEKLLFDLSQMRIVSYTGSRLVKIVKGLKYD